MVIYIFSMVYFYFVSWLDSETQKDQERAPGVMHDVKGVIRRPQTTNMSQYRSASSHSSLLDTALEPRFLVSRIRWKS